MDLQVRNVGGQRGAYEGDLLENAVLQEGTALDDFLGHALGEVRRAADMRAVVNLVGHRYEQVVVEVVTHRQVSDHVDAELLEVVGRPQPGQLQDLRRTEDTCRNDDFLASADHLGVTALVGDLHAGGAAIVDDHLVDVHPGAHIKPVGLQVMDVAT